MSTLKLPKQVQKQADDAAALEAQLKSAPPPNAGAVTDVTQLVAPPPAPVETPPVVETPPQLPAAEPPKAPRAEDFEHKYRVLQGMFNRQNDDLKATQQQLADAVKKMEALTAKPAEPAPKPAADPKDVEAFGADMIAMVQRYAEQTFTALSQQFNTAFSAVEGRLAQLESQLTGVSKQTTLSLEQAYWAELERLVPDLQAINVDPAFLAFLSEVDPVFGVPRQAGLAQAENALDAKRVAAIFNGFKATRPTQSSTPNPLSSQVAPSTAASAAPAPAQSAAPVTMAAINRFYDDLRRGRYAGREAEAQRIEEEINRAAAEGRVIQ